MPSNKEVAACTPVPLNPKGFNPAAQLPYGVKAEHVQRAMQDFIDFIGFINLQLNSKKIERLESFLMPANFSSIVGEFMGAAIPKYCKTVLRNKYHNGHPDIVPKGHYPEDSILHDPGRDRSEGKPTYKRLARAQPGRRLANGLRLRFQHVPRCGAGYRRAAVPIRQSSWRTHCPRRLGIFWPIRNKPPDNHGQRHTIRLREDGSQLDLSRVRIGFSGHSAPRRRDPLWALRWLVIEG